MFCNSFTRIAGLVPMLSSSALTTHMKFTEFRRIARLRRLRHLLESLLKKRTLTSRIVILLIRNVSSKFSLLMRFWLFEARCSAHDIGGWYVETYGRDRKRKTVPSQRYWDGFNTHQECEEKLHPAVYLPALAYRTLDIENVRRTKQTLWDIAQGNLSKMLHWCKKLV